MGARFIAVSLAIAFGAETMACAQQPVPPPLKVFTADPAPEAKAADSNPGWSPDQTPADFLDSIGGRVRIRWRQQYRPGASAPSNERTRAAFVLGSIVADGFLALQATDAQQFRNTNQDVLTYCRTLGLGEKLTPRLMSQGKLAEMEQWADLRQEIVDGHQELCRFLREQRDEDLATLVDLGVWLRLLHITSSAIVEADEPAHFPLSIGSPALLKEMILRYDQLKQVTREVERINDLGSILGVVGRQWIDSGEPDKERVIKTRDKLAELITKISQR